MSILNYLSGTKVRRFQYESFEPSLINQYWHSDSDAVTMLLSEADRKLGELNAFGQLIPDVDFFIQMHIFKEGTTSSRIEGTQTNIDEAVQKEAYIDPEKKDDWQEVQNYILAMNTAIEAFSSLPLSNRLIKQTHRILLQGVRGKHKQPGEFRTSQNWIGGSSLNDAKFIPPHHDGVLDYMADLENFMHNTDAQLPHLIKIGILHYQFETIHPFLDGNGRIGRLLITLYLVNFGLLTKPILYLSDFFEKHKTYYYDNLTNVRIKNDLEHWLKFFLEGIRATAENSIDTFKKIIVLRTKVESEIISLGKKQMLAKLLLQYLYSQPITDTQSVAENLKVSFATAYRLIKIFMEIGILIELTGYKRNKIYVFEDYLKLFR